MGGGHVEGGSHDKSTQWKGNTTLKTLTDERADPIAEDGGGVKPPRQEKHNRRTSCDKRQSLVRRTGEVLNPRDKKTLSTNVQTLLWTTGEVLNPEKHIRRTSCDKRQSLVRRTGEVLNLRDKKTH